MEFEIYLLDEIGYQPAGLLLYVKIRLVARLALYLAGISDDLERSVGVQLLVSSKASNLAEIDICPRNPGPGLTCTTLIPLPLGSTPHASKLRGASTPCEPAKGSINIDASEKNMQQKRRTLFEAFRM